MVNIMKWLLLCVKINIYIYIYSWKYYQLLTDYINKLELCI